MGYHKLFSPRSCHKLPSPRGYHKLSSPRDYHKLSSSRGYHKLSSRYVWTLELPYKYFPGITKIQGRPNWVYGCYYWQDKLKSKLNRALIPAQTRHSTYTSCSASLLFITRAYELSIENLAGQMLTLCLLLLSVDNLSNSLNPDQVW